MPSSSAATISPLLVLFVTSGDGFGTVATTEVVAVEVVRTLCGSVGLIAAVPLTTVLAAAVATEPTQAVEGAATPTATGPTSYAPARGLAAADAQLLFAHVLDLHRSRLSHAEVGVASSPLALDGLPAEARRAATQLQRLAATASRGGSWYRRAVTAGRVRLDLNDPDQLDLLRRCGPFSTDARVWASDDPVPVIEHAEALDGQPRATYRLKSDQLDRLRGELHQAGLDGTILVPRRSRAHHAG